jgi:hypothetical protein
MEMAGDPQIITTISQKIVARMFGISLVSTPISSLGTMMETGMWIIVLIMDPRRETTEEEGGARAIRVMIFWSSLVSTLLTFSEIVMIFRSISAVSVQKVITTTRRTTIEVVMEIENTAAIPTMTSMLSVIIKETKEIATIRALM